VKTRVIDISGGEVEYVTGLVTENTGASLATTTFQVRLVSPTGSTDWQDADLVAFPTPATARVSMLIDDEIPPRPNYRLHIRATDDPEVIDLDLDGPSERIDVT
jgi:hypothetical protein